MKITVLPGDDSAECPLHGYSETSARHKLERHRKRGDLSVRAWLHDACGQWHVEDATEWPPYLTGQGHVHYWGVLGRGGALPALDDLCYVCGQSYESLPIAVHDVDPDRLPLTDGGVA